MKKLDRFILRYFLYILPLVVIFGFYDSTLTDHAVDAQPMVAQSLYYLGALATSFWMLFAFYISGRLFFSRSYRTEVLTALCFFKERDERELILSGQATRSAFLTTLSVLILVFCFASLKVAIYHIIPSSAASGHTGRFELGFAFDFFSDANPLFNSSKIDSTQPSYLFNGLPLSKPGLLLLLILVQIASYNYFLRQLIGVEKEPPNLKIIDSKDDNQN